MSASNAKPSGEIVPLADRLRYTQVFRLAVTGLAYDTSFLVSAEDFWGVKALLLAPPALVAIVAAHRVLGRPHWSDTVTILNGSDHAMLINMRVVAAGPVGEVFTRENLQRTYGGRLTLLAEASEAAGRV